MYIQSKCLSTLFVALLITLFSFNAQAQRECHRPEGCFLTLDPGVAVQLYSNAKLNANLLKKGARIQFLVKEDVKVKRRTVIRAGSIASAVLERALDPSCITAGDACSVVISLQFVRAVDGQMIRLNTDGQLELVTSPKGEIDVRETVIALPDQDYDIVIGD